MPAGSIIAKDGFSFENNDVIVELLAANSIEIIVIDCNIVFSFSFILLST